MARLPSGLMKVFSGEYEGCGDELAGHGRSGGGFDEEIEDEPGGALHQRIALLGQERPCRW